MAAKWKSQATPQKSQLQLSCFSQTTLTSPRSQVRSQGRPLLIPVLFYVLFLAIARLSTQSHEFFSFFPRGMGSFPMVRVTPRGTEYLQATNAIVPTYGTVRIRTASPEAV